MMHFNATSLYPSAMYNEKSVYPKVESGFAFKLYMNIVYVEAFNIQTFNQDGNESAILKIKFYNPPDLILQLLPDTEKVKNTELNQFRNCYLMDFLANVDFQEIVKIGGKFVEINESVIYWGNFKISPFRKGLENLFDLRQIYKDEGNDLMQSLVKLKVNSLYGVQFRKDKIESYKCEPQH